MQAFRILVLSSSIAALTAGCLGGGDSSSGRPDASLPATPDASGGGNGAPPPDAAPPPSFDTLELQLIPETPRPGFEFTLYIRAADDDGRLFRGYDGVVSIEDSSGELLGLTEGLQVSGGTLFVPLTYENELEDVTLTVTDDEDPTITAATEPFQVEFEGSKAELGDVVISEVNWFGSGSFLEEYFEVQDNWIEIRNVSGEALNLAQWTIQNAAPEGNDIAIDSGTVVPDGGYLLLAMLRGDATFPSSLAGVPNVQLQPVALPDEGVELILLDVEDTVIDRTPDPNGDGWAAGNAEAMLSMERVEDPGDGSQADRWQTFNPSDTSTTSPGTFDEGTPGADSSDPTLASPLPLATSLELGEPKFELISGADEAELLRSAPPGTTPRNGDHVLTTTSLTTDIEGRSMRTVECLALDGDDDVHVTWHGVASEHNDNAPPDEVIRGRVVVEWYRDSGCETRHDIRQSSQPPQVLPTDEYLASTYSTGLPPPAEDATHIKVRFDAQLGTDDTDDLWAADDFRIEQVAD